MLVALQRLPEMLASSSHQTQVFLSTETTSSMSSKASSMSSPKGTGNNQQRETQGIHHDARCCQHHPGMKHVETMLSQRSCNIKKQVKWHSLSRENENPLWQHYKKNVCRHNTTPNHTTCVFDHWHTIVNMPLKTTNASPPDELCCAHREEQIS